MNIVYNASAGTGKTYQVTQLYEKLVIEEGFDPREILLMTFTDNAAAELRMRVAHRIQKARRTAETTGDDATAARAAQAAGRLASAPIGTIHSFCTRLLREHALEAGLSPGFSILEGDERSELLGRICRDELLAQLDTDPDFTEFCSGAHIIGTGQGFGTSITETVPVLIAQAGSLGISLDRAVDLLPAPEAPGARIEFEQICIRITELPKITPTVQTALDTIRQALNETDDVEGLVERLNALGIQKFGRGAKEISADFWDLKTSVEDAVRYRERLPAAQAFARYIQTVSRRFQQSKHKMNAVDFDDLLRLAADLLKSGKINRPFSHVIVDEVQDTSRIQCDIIECLWRNAGTDRETELIICGDKKQSIYTWRGADPQVMPDLEKALLDAGGKQEVLQTSYRSKGPILDVVNTLFTAVYGSDDYSESDRLLINGAESTPDEIPCVEFLEPNEETDAPKHEKVVAEMTAVANRIKLLTEGAAEWRPAYRYSETFRPVSETNRYTYSDVLILLRRMTHLPELEQALRHTGIPYTLGGKGRGLFTRQETRDISLFLSVLTDPKDGWSLIGFLRSPWVGLSDERIAQLAWTNNGFSAEQLIERACRSNGCHRALPGPDRYLSGIRTGAATDR